MKISRKVRLIALGVLLVVIDQIVKVLVKTNMELGETIPVIGNWFRLCFVENEGMAFGMKFGGVVGKCLLSIFRLILAGILIWWIDSLRKKNEAPLGVLIGLTMITAGAIGNLIDCMFYGLIFDNAMAGAPMPFLFGKVVDMFSATFFPPVFNFADSCVSVGAAYLILFQWKFFASSSH